MQKIDSTYIDPRLLSTDFVCDLTACKGACCTFPGGSGPPILTSEMADIEKAFSVVKHTLPADHAAIADKYGLFEHSDDEWSIRCFKRRACIFVVYEGAIAKCAIQNSFRKGELDFPKPQSCHLFPIRVQQKENVLYFEEFSECSPAFLHGAETKTNVIEFLKEPITRVFGDSFYTRLRALTCFEPKG
jgi:hypothetical protein